MKASLRKPKKQITVQFFTVIPMETMLCTRLLEGCSSCKLLYGRERTYCTYKIGSNVFEKSFHSKLLCIKEYSLAIRKSFKIIEHERGNLMLIWCAFENNARVWRNHVVMDAT